MIHFTLALLIIIVILIVVVVMESIVIHKADIGFIGFWKTMFK